MSPPQEALLYFQNICLHDPYLAFVLFCHMEQCILLDNILKRFRVTCLQRFKNQAI